MAKMGRPKAENPKRLVLGMKVDEQEADRVQREASKAGLTVSMYLRTKVGLEKCHGPCRGKNR